VHGIDELSKSLLRFKSKLQVDVQAWIECSVVELSKIINSNFIVVRALHGGELEAGNSSLDLLGVSLVKELNCQYRPQLVKKSRLTKSLKFLNKEERKAEIQGTYSFQPDDGDFRNSSFLIIDDILTTGTTLKAIGDAITATTCNTDISFYSLAYSDYQANLNQHVELSGDTYSWQHTQGWIVAEGHAGYNELISLKNQIQNNFQDLPIKKGKSLRR